MRLHVEIKVRVLYSQSYLVHILTNWNWNRKRNRTWRQSRGKQERVVQDKASITMPLSPV